MKVSTSRWVAYIGLLASMALATGCSGTLQTRYVRPSDTYALWSRRMESLAIRVHADGGMFVVADVRGQPVAWNVPIDVTARVEVYVGGMSDSAPADACRVVPTVPPVQDNDGRMRVTAVLCDGGRLVATATDTLSRGQAAPSQWLYQRMEHQLLHAIDVSAAQIPVQQYG